jgi:hypothetical protein
VRADPQILVGRDEPQRRLDERVGRDVDRMIRQLALTFEDGLDDQLGFERAPRAQLDEFERTA